MQKLPIDRLGSDHRARVPQVLFVCVANAGRSQLGAHYTSERDIMKVIRSLFLDALKAEWARLRDDRSVRRAGAIHGRPSAPCHAAATIDTVALDMTTGVEMRACLAKTPRFVRAQAALVGRARGKYGVHAPASTQTAVPAT